MRDEVMCICCVTLLMPIDVGFHKIYSTCHATHSWTSQFKIESETHIKWNTKTWIKCFFQILSPEVSNRLSWPKPQYICSNWLLAWHKTAPTSEYCLVILHAQCSRVMSCACREEPSSSGLDTSPIPQDHSPYQISRTDFHQDSSQ